MGFLSAYSTIRRVPIDDTYWVDLREHLSQGAKEKGDRALQQVQIVGGKAQPTPDTVEFREQLVLASIADWNIDDDNGTVWPINMQSIRRLPASVFDLLWEVVDETNAPRKPAEQAQFPAGDVRGDPHGNPGTAEPVNVQPAAAVLAAPGDDQG